MVQREPEGGLTSISMLRQLLIGLDLSDLILRHQLSLFVSNSLSPADIATEDYLRFRSVAVLCLIPCLCLIHLSHPRRLMHTFLKLQPSQECFLLIAHSSCRIQVRPHAECNLFGVILNLLTFSIYHNLCTYYIKFCDKNNISIFRLVQLFLYGQISRGDPLVLE